jgi:hypothetical protein
MCCWTVTRLMSIDPYVLGPYVHVHRLDSATGRDLVGVRPDGYVGFRGDSRDLDQLHTWLTRIGAMRRLDVAMTL